MKIGILAAIVLTGSLLLRALVYYNYERPQKLWSLKVLELGERPSSRLEDYVRLGERDLNEYEVDVSAVDHMHVGTYTALVNKAGTGKSIIYTYEVRDTTAPELTVAQKTPVLLPGETYETDVLGVEATDLSGDALVRYFVKEEEVTEFCFEDPMETKLRITAEDASGNLTEKTIPLIIDSPPQLFGVGDMYIVQGSDSSALNPAFASDREDGDLSCYVEIDDSDVDYANRGTYVVTYRVEDAYGVEDLRDCMVYVTTPGEVAQHRMDNPLDESEFRYLVNNGYFQYRPMKKMGRSELLELVEPTLVDLCMEYSHEILFGSGFVYKITSDTVYFLSVEHVTEAYEESGADLIFYDGERIHISMDTVRMSEENEIVLFQVPTKKIPYHTLVNLKTVAWKKDIYDELPVGSRLYAYAKNWAGGNKEDVVKTVAITDYDLCEMWSRFRSNDAYFMTTGGPYGGMSGTAVFDERGYLAGVCSSILASHYHEDGTYHSDSAGMLYVDGLEELYSRR